MRDRPYAMLLDRDGKATERLPAAEKQATLVFLERLVVKRIVNVADAAAVRQELESAPSAQ